MGSLCVLVGNPKAGSRTLGVARALGDAIATAIPGLSAGEVVDLATIAREIFNPDSAIVEMTLAGVAASDVVVVASPTFKASYTGLLKSFLDRYGAGGLSNTICIPVMTGAAPVHALAPEIFLRPLLVELGATVPSRGLYVVESQFAELPTVIDKWLRDAVDRIEMCLSPRTRDPAVALRHHPSG
jgi:FMN reductase